MRRIGKGVRYLLTGLLILLVAGMLLMRLLGVQAYRVLSGSMEPAYPTGSILYVKKLGQEALRAGDVITFRLTEGVTATHRIIEVLGSGDEVRYRTKGDANDVADGGAVPRENVLGRPVFMIPYIGYATAYIQQPAVRAALLGILLTVFAASLHKKEDDAEYGEEKGTSYTRRDRNDGKAIRKNGGRAVAQVAHDEGLPECVLDRRTDLPAGTVDSERISGLRPE